MAIKEKEAQEAVRKLLSAMEIDITKHPDMEKTPERVIKMLKEVWAGEYMTDDEIAAEFAKTFPANSNDMVVVKDIDAFSYCEHHLALMYNMKISVAYIPNGCVIGLSKIPRIVDMVSRRLQLQERIGTQIANILQKIVGKNVCVKIEASHSCLTARGIKKPNAKTVTFVRRGAFQEKPAFEEFLSAV